jgi:Helix-turn-helix domain (DUF4817)
MNFPKEELIDMIYVLGEAEKNCLLATRIYGMKYPERRQPNKTVFKNLMQRFDATGSVDYPKHQVTNKNVTNENKEIEILLHVHENPEISSRQLSKLAETSQSTVNRITRKYNYHPYHLELHQELHGNDFQNRIDFCNIMLQRCRENYNFLSVILFTDEATFKSNGMVNRHNMHYYETNNPHWMKEITFQNRWSLNVWCGIINNEIIGPYLAKYTCSFYGVTYNYFCVTSM